jgi:hypothetical protein
MHITCPVYIMFLDLLSLIEFGEENRLWFSNTYIILLYIYIYRWVPVPTAWRVLGLRMEERPPANRSNKQPRKEYNGWTSSLGVGRGANNPSS